MLTGYWAQQDLKIGFQGLKFFRAFSMIMLNLLANQLYLPKKIANGLRQSSFFVNYLKTIDFPFGF